VPVSPSTSSPIGGIFEQPSEQIRTSASLGQHSLEQVRHRATCSYVSQAVFEW